MNSIVNQRIIVVGAGVIGCSLADELTRRGASVTVIDAAAPGSGTSSATFAWVNANSKTPAEYYELNYLGLRAHERVDRSLPRNGARWFHQTGTVQVAHSDEGMNAIEAQVSRLCAEGYQARLLSGSDVADVEPNLNSAKVCGGALYAQEGWIDVQTMCVSLLDRAVERGAEFFPYQTVTRLRERHVTTTSADGGTHEHEADVVILAAGNGTRRILANEGIEFPTIDPVGDVGPGGTGHPKVGIISTTSMVDSGIRHLIRSEGIALRPARNGGITFADNPTGGKWEMSDPGIWTVPALLLDRARELYPALNQTTTESVLLGTRVLPDDGLTIADWVDENRSVYAVATHSGVTLSAHLADAISGEVLDGDRHASLESFGLSRFIAA